MGNDDNNKIIIDALQNINNKLLEHDKQFTGISDTLTKLIEVDMSIKDLQLSNKRCFVRVETLENQCNNAGCPALKAREDVRAEQIKHYDNIVEVFNNRLNLVETAIKKMESLPNELLKKVLLTIVSTIVGGVVLAFFFHKDF